MTSIPATPVDWAVVAIQAMLGAAGSLVREIKSDKPKKLKDYAAEMLVGSFTGAITGLLLGDYMSGSLLYGLCGIGGYLGILLLDPVAQVLRKVILDKLTGPKPA